jgi:hypothetical protein
MFCRRFSAACIVHGISFIFYQMECLDGDDLTSLNDTSQCSKSCQLKVSMRNLIKHLNFFHLTLDLDLKKGRKKNFYVVFRSSFACVHSMSMHCIDIFRVKIATSFPRDNLIFLHLLGLLNFNLNGSAHKHLCL